MADTSARLVPNCKVLVDGSPLDPPIQASLVRLAVDLDADLFAQTTLLFADPNMKLMQATTFACGAAVKIKLGYGANLEAIFDGEVVRLEPQFRKDEPIALQVVCQEPMHRLALSQSTRALNDVDVSGVVTQIAQDHGFSSEAPSGTKQHIMQGNVTDAVMLRRLATRLGMRVRVEGKKLIMAAPDSTDPIPLLMSDGIRKVKVKVKSAGQVSQIDVHGWDAKNKQEVVGSAKPQGEVGQGGTSYGDSAVISDSSGDNLPPDQSTAEAMAKGRMTKLNEGYIKSQTDMIGDARMVPGQQISFDKMGPGIDGTWRVERAVHDFSRRGYFVKMEAVRISAKKPAPPAPAKTKEDDKPTDAGQLIRPRWKRRTQGQQDVADMAVDASASLEGKSVKFVLETKVDGAWKQVATGNGTVSSGTAIATGNLDQLDTSQFTNPTWTAAKNSSHTSGDSGEASLTATGAKDGIDVRVILEQQDGTGWTRIQQKISSVKSGAVKATFTLAHPFEEEAGKPNTKLLKIPSWNTHPQVHGGAGAVQVRAPGLPDGRKVQFDVERMGADGKWTLVRTVQGTVDHGTANISLPDVRHPAFNQQPAHADVLKKPTWDKTDLSHGSAGTFSVEAPDLDGRMVAFIVERNDNGNWTQLVRAMGTVASGKASASASFAHPTALTHKPDLSSAASKAKLSNPRWGKKNLAHGDEVQAIIDAAGLDGVTIEFVAERKEVGGWVEAGRARGVVEKGKAQATIQVEHPSGDATETPSDGPTVAPRLSNPRWQTTNFSHGDQATAIIDAAGLDGASIQFIAERLEEGGWVEAGRGFGSVSGGKATANITIQHPGTDASLRKFRFRASVFNDPNDALDVPLPVKYDPKTGKATASTGGDHDGRQVRFILEERKAVGWTTITSVSSRAMKGQATAQLPTSAAAPTGKISAPRWGADKLSHGDDAELVVDAKGLDGQQVKFTVERLLDGGSWTGVGVATAVVAGGKATGHVKVSHPQANETTEQEMSKLRFSAALVGQAETRVRAEMLPDTDPRQLRFRASVVDDPSDKPDDADLKVTYDIETGSATTTVSGDDAGRMVRFTLEEKNPTGWKSVASATGRASAKGDVKVMLPVHHKAGAKLSNPSWAKKALLHGDQAQMVVDAKGLDGHQVKFIIERFDSGAWAVVGNALAQVNGGKATGSATVQHPQGSAVSLSKLRFRAVLNDAPQTRVTAEILPDLDPKRLRFRAELVPDYTKQKLRFVAKPVPDLLPKKLRFRGELPVPQDPALTRMTASADGVDDVTAGGPSSS